MKRTRKCPKCESTDIIADASPLDRGHNNAAQEMSVATYGKPEALIFKDRRETTVSAYVCSSCGYIELYADQPGKVKLPEV